MICRFFIPQKNRTCRLPAHEGSEFCGHHLKTRIPCPLDPSHTIYTSDLERHVQKCNARPPETRPDYFCENINCMTSAVENSSEQCLDVNDQDLLQIVDNILEKCSNSGIYSDCTPQPNIDDSRTPGKSERHLLQMDALIKLIGELILQGSKGSETMLMLEFGAGKAALSERLGEHLVSKCSFTHDRLNYALIDRKTCVRHSRDGKLVGSSVRRLKLDIKDLELRQLIQSNYSDATQTLAYSKHLCGVATDLTINCLLNARLGTSLKGALIALCCHHRMEYDNYCNQEYLRENGISRADFERMICLSSWATCDGAVTGERREIGLKIKQVLDIGRVLWLRKNGYKNTKLSTYISERVTLENQCMLILQ